MIALAADLRWRPRDRAPVARPWAPAVSTLLHGVALLLVLVWLPPRRASEPAAQEGVEMFWQQEEGEAIGEGTAQDLPGAPEEVPEPSPVEATADPTPPDAAASPPVEAAPSIAEPEPAAEPVVPEPPLPQPQAPLPPPPPPTPAVAPPRQQAQPSPAAQPAPPSRSKRSEQANEPAGLSTMSAPVRITGATTQPSIDFQPPQPTYPEAARRMNQTGATKVKLHIDVAGRVTQVEILESSGHAALDRATQTYAEKFRFRPALRDGQPVPSFSVTTVHWRLSR